MFAVTHSAAVLRKVAGETITTPRKGSKTSKSLSPLIIWLALPLMANSKNLLSFSSRHSVITCVTCMISAVRTKAAKNSSLFLAGIYLLNFGRHSTSSNSASVSSDTNNYPYNTTKSNACRDIERGSKTALTTTFVSMTARSLFFIEQ